MRQDGDHLDADEARARGCTNLQVRVVELWNDDTSWRAIANTLGITQKSARRSFAAVNAKLRGNPDPTNDVTAATPDATSHPDLMRGIPLLARGITGAIPGTRPGDPAWRAVADHKLKPARRNS